jgi:hypothetical protein
LSGEPPDANRKRRPRGRGSEEDAVLLAGAQVAGWFRSLPLELRAF